MDITNHERRTWMPGYAITIEIVTTLLLGIRLLSRVNRTGGILGLDDLFITIGWAIATVNIGLIVKFSYSYGLDRHIWDVPPNLWPKAAEYSWIIAVLFLWSTAFTKISVLLFYRRLVAGTYSKRFKWALWAGIGFILVWTFILFVLLCVTCTPLDAEWLRVDPTYIGKYHCTSLHTQQRISEWGGAFSVITDFYSVALPAFLLMKIKITRRQRIGLMFVFGLGFLVVIAGIVRTVYLGRVQGNSLDKTWLAFNVFAAGTAEGNVAVICACAPSLKSCFRTYFKDHISSITNTIRSRTAGITEMSDGSNNSRTGPAYKMKDSTQPMNWTASSTVQSEGSLFDGQAKNKVVEMYDPGAEPRIHCGLEPRILEAIYENDSRTTRRGHGGPPSFLYFSTDEDEELGVALPERVQVGGFDS